MNQLILKPVVTEKSFGSAERGVYSFIVPASANKLMVKKAVATQFKVTPTDVRMAIIKGKVKSLRGVSGQRSDLKKAYVQLKAGQKIALFEAESKDDATKKSTKAASKPATLPKTENVTTETPAKVIEQKPQQRGGFLSRFSRKSGEK